MPRIWSGMWLIDPRNPDAREGRHELQREFHGDAALLASVALTGVRSAVVFESGRASLLTAVKGEAPTLGDFIDQLLKRFAFKPTKRDVGHRGDVKINILPPRTPDEIRRQQKPDDLRTPVFHGTRQGRDAHDHRCK